MGMCSTCFNEPDQPLFLFAAETGVKTIYRDRRIRLYEGKPTPGFEPGTPSLRGTYLGEHTTLDEDSALAHRQDERPLQIGVEAAKRAGGPW
jgi:hypothetical protein